MSTAHDFTVFRKVAGDKIWELIERAEKAERELAEMCTQRDAAVAARIELAKDNLALIKELESIGITTLNGVPNMTLRDHFAGQAMNGIMAESSPSNAVDWVGDVSYAIADSMITARNKEDSK